METPQDQTSGAVAGRSAARPAKKGDSGAPLRVIKPGQGQYVRWGTAIGAGIVGVAAAMFLHEQLITRMQSEAWRLGLPLVLLAVFAAFIFYVVGRHRGAVDFMIATEGEMKKVNWSSRREVMGSTKVVIVTVLGMSILLFAADLFFIVVLSAIKVLKIDILSQLLGVFSSKG